LAVFIASAKKIWPMVVLPRDGFVVAPMGCGCEEDMVLGSANEEGEDATIEGGAGGYHIPHWR
jgi:hypothetical protein